MDDSRELVPVATQPTSMVSPRQRMTLLSGLLGRAFFADPLVVHIQPSVARRRRGLPFVYRACLRYAEAMGNLVVDPQGRGVLAWIPFDRLDLSVVDMFRYGYVWMAPRFGLFASLRMASHEAWCVKRYTPRVPPGAAYLYALGVDPACAGQGIGKALVHRGLAEMTERHAHCVLRTDNPRNVRFYEGLGFECIDEATAPGATVPSWLFVRSLRADR